MSKKLPFSEGLADVEIDDKWGYVDKTGTIVIELQPYDIVGEFKNGLAEMKTEEEKGYIDKTGKIVWKATE